MTEPIALSANRPGRVQSEFDVEFDPSTSTVFWWMTPRGRPCFTQHFLISVREFELPIEQSGGYIDFNARRCHVANYVVGSRVPGVFNLGGDMSMFIQAILRKDVTTLRAYAALCVENMHRRIRGFGSGISTYSLVQGRAFGGGFECALASETIIAERSAVFSLPEILFNMIPGMGAISLLGRRIGLSKAQEVVMSGLTFTAKEMRELGVVDEVVDDGTGDQSVRRIIATRARRANSYRAMSAAKRCFLPVDLEEMRRIVEIWVDAALRLETRDLRMMARLVRAQDRMMALTEDETILNNLFGDHVTAVGSG